MNPAEAIEFLEKTQRESIRVTSVFSDCAAVIRALQLENEVLKAVINDPHAVRDSVRGTRVALLPEVERALDNQHRLDDLESSIGAFEEDVRMMLWLADRVDHLPATQGAPLATRLSIVLNGGHFDVREMIRHCMKLEAGTTPAPLPPPDSTP